VIVYGFRTPTFDAPHLAAIHRLIGIESQLHEPGTLPPVDIFPILAWVPERFWGNWSSLKAKIRDLNGIIDEFFHRAQERRTRGLKDLFSDMVIEEQSPWPRSDLPFLTKAVVEGGSDTTSLTITTFIHLIAQNIQCAIEAQNEIDSAVGEDRTPTWSDFAQLPSVNALIKETLRYRPITPNSFPHALTQGLLNSFY
jgi:cytochrome P450